MSNSGLTYRRRVFGGYLPTTLRGLCWLNTGMAILTLLLSSVYAASVDRQTLFILVTTLWVVAVHWNAVRLIRHLWQLEQEGHDPTPTMTLMYEMATTLPVIGLLPVLLLGVFLP